MFVVAVTWPWSQRSCQPGHFCSLTVKRVVSSIISPRSPAGGTSPFSAHKPAPYANLTGLIHNPPGFNLNPSQPGGLCVSAQFPHCHWSVHCSSGDSEQPSPSDSSLKHVSREVGHVVFFGGHVHPAGSTVMNLTTPETWGGVFHEISPALKHLS